jgi:HTH-type transcriptional regulator, glycine betaine synthesis regulator
MSENEEREAEALAADAIGDVIEHWGFRKVLGRVWTVLYLADDVLGSAEMGERLQMSAGAVSMALTELQRWGVVRRVWKPGERREFYEAETDFWKMISRVVQDRERSLIVSVRERLETARGLLRKAPQTAANRTRIERIGRLLTLTGAAETVIGSFLASRRADFSEFSDLLVLSRTAAVSAFRSRRG